MHEKYTRYEDLPSIESFYGIFRSDLYFDAPRSWFVVMTDVVNSTRAIEEGRYKEVNTAGCIAAMAISNLKSDMQFPFLFGGDGMTYLIPGHMVEAVRNVLADTRALVRDVFSLELRIGIIPVAELDRRGARVKVAKVHVSDSYEQAIIAGRGSDLAEELLKDPSPDNPWIIPEDWPVSSKADYSGFTCRWNDIPSNKGETVSLIVKGRGAHGREREQRMREVLADLEALLGNPREYHPLNNDGLTASLKEAYREQRVMSRQRRGIRHFFYGLMLKGMIPMMRFIIRFRIPMKAQGIEIRNIKQNFLMNADFQKFDGSLKMVLALSSAQVSDLEAFLENRRANGSIFYGMHRSDRALMTCLMHMKSGNEVHFVDAADGGYALAAKAMKQQIAST